MFQPDKKLPVYNITPVILNDVVTSTIIGKDSSFCQSIFPLQLLSFNATLVNKNVNVQWKTTNEVNTSYFNIQRSMDVVQFTTVGSIIANGNIALQNEYSYADNLSA